MLIERFDDWNNVNDGNYSFYLGIDDNGNWSDIEDEEIYNRLDEVCNNLNISQNILIADSTNTHTMIVNNIVEAEEMYNLIRVELEL